MLMYSELECYCIHQGHGKNSRHSQMVVALCDTPGCRTTTLGKADWEVPVGTIRRDGFRALVDVEMSGFPYPRLEMGGQHPKAAGPDQSKIHRDPEYLQREYSFMEYWRGCRVVERDLSLDRPLYLDHAAPIMTPEMYRRFPNTPLDNGHVFVEMMIVINGDNSGGPAHNLAKRVVIEVSSP